MIEFNRKKQILLQYAREFNIKTMVETGTYTGQMIEACLLYFDKIYSIELCDTLYINALEKFKHCDNVTLLQGDSGIVLEAVVKQLERPALFWLDAHYSGETTVKGDKNTPIREELDCIFNSFIKNHIISIDDARYFGVDEDYPSIKEVVEKAKKHNMLTVVIEDIIRIVS